MIVNRNNGTMIKQYLKLTVKLSDWFHIATDKRIANFTHNYKHTQAYNKLAIKPTVFLCRHKQNEINSLLTDHIAIQSAIQIIKG